MVSFERSRETLGLSDDAVTIEKLNRLLKQSQALLSELSPATIEQINFRSPLLENEKEAPLKEVILKAVRSAPAGAKEKVTVIIPPFHSKPSPTKNWGVFHARKDAVASLASGVGLVHKEVRQLKRPNGHMDHKAVVVAGACRKIWREEIGNEPPLELNFNRDTPFSRFIQAVFEVLEIRSTPSAALSRLKKLGGEQALRLSVEKG